MSYEKRINGIQQNEKDQKDYLTQGDPVFHKFEGFTPEQEFQEALQKAYIDSKYMEMKEKQEERGEDFTVLFTDIDNTFHRDDAPEDSSELTREAREQDVPITAITGNNFESVVERIHSGELPYFEIIAGSGGTEIYILNENDKKEKRYIKDEAFQQLLEKSGYNRKDLAQLASLYVSEDTLNHPEHELDFQHPEDETLYRAGDESKAEEFKMSFYFFAQSLEEMQEVVESAQKRFPNQEIVCCEEIHYNKTLPEGELRKKYCLDVLPVTKAGTVQYIRDITGIKQGMVSGDSGNDIDMLLNSGSLYAALVGGAKEEALAAIKAATVEHRGKSSWRSVVGKDGRPKAIYVENSDERKGAKSIMRAARELRLVEHLHKNKKNT